MRLIGDWPARRVADDAGNDLGFAVFKHLAEFQALDCRIDTRNKDLKCLCTGLGPDGHTMRYHSAIEIGTFKSEFEALAAVAMTMLGPPDGKQINARCVSVAIP